MCGIHGVLNPRGDVRDAVAAMHASLAHRGPDADAIETLPFAVLGHRRLAIIDLSPAGAQPLWDVQRNACIVFNGEIYNYRELRAECVAAGLPLHSASDTEVIVNQYLMHGEQAFAKLNGMFAFCLADVRTGEAYLVRDRAGVKPLYYAETDRGLAFASELGALLAGGLVPREVDAEALQAYSMLDFVPAPMAMVKGVRKLPGGMLLHVKGEATARRSAGVSPALGERGPAGGRHSSGRSSDITALLREVVERQLIADVPVGVLLSGGIDSSLVAAAAADVAGRISTFSIAFDDPSFDERPYFDEVAKIIGSDHHVETLTSRAMLDLLPRVARIASEPLADGSLFPTYLLSRFTRQHVKVALSGDGADELFAGYPTHAVARLGQLASYLPLRKAALFAAHKLLPVSHANLSFDFRVKKFLEGLDRDPVLRNERWLASFQPEELPSLLTRYDPGAWQRLAELLHEPSRGVADPLERILRTDRRFYLQDGVLVKTDRASMAASLEVRVPMLDNAMLDFADALPANQKLRGGTTKWILREAASQRFPESIWRRKKKGFGAPLAHWFRHELRDVVRDTLSPERIARRGFHHPATITRLLDEHERGTRDHRKRILNVLMVSIWYDDMLRR